MESLRRNCKREFDGPVVGPGLPPLLHVCDLQSVSAYHRLSLGAQSALAVSARGGVQSGKGLHRTALITCVANTSRLNWWS